MPAGRGPDFACVRLRLAAARVLGATQTKRQPAVCGYARRRVCTASDVVPEASDGRLAIEGRELVLERNADVLHARQQHPALDQCKSATSAVERWSQAGFGWLPGLGSEPVAHDGPVASRKVELREMERVRDDAERIADHRPGPRTRHPAPLHRHHPPRLVAQRLFLLV